jgi:phosphonate transport system substrate-binding protein
MNMPRLIAQTLMLATWCAIAVAPASAAPLVLAVHPYLPEPEIQQRFTPLAQYFAQALGEPVEVRVGSNYDEHVAAIGNNRVDIAFMGPASYVLLVAQYGKKPLLAGFEVDGKSHLYGVIFTRQSSPVQRLEDLKGKRFAFGDKESTMSHIVPHYMLIQAGVPLRVLDDVQFLGSHKNVAHAVLAGEFDAGAVKREVYEEFAAKGLRALATSPPVPDHLFVTRADFPASKVERLRAALLRLKGTAAGRSMMNGIHAGMTAFIPVTDGDYDGLRVMIRAVDNDPP